MQTLQNIKRKTTPNLLGINLEEKKYKLVISYDGYENDSPLEWQDDIILACEHSRYNIGHSDGISLLQDAIMEHRRYGTKAYDKWEEEEYIDFNSLGDLLKVIERFNMTDKINILPVSLYDHSGLSMRIGSARGWDCGQVGVAFQRINTMSTKRKTFNKELIEESDNYIKGVVSTYSQYLEGDIYCLSLVEVIGGKEEVVDCCGGFYGLNEEDIKDYLLDILEGDALQAYKAGKLEIINPF